MRFDCTTAAGLRDALARTPRPMAMGRPRLLAALPEDLTHRVLGVLVLRRDTIAQRFLGIVERTRRALDDRRQLQTDNGVDVDYISDDELREQYIYCNDY